MVGTSAFVLRTGVTDISILRRSGANYDKKSLDNMGELVLGLKATLALKTLAFSKELFHNST